MLLRIYAKCLVGQDELAKRRIAEALRDGDDTPDTDHGHESADPGGEEEEEREKKKREKKTPTDLTAYSPQPATYRSTRLHTAA